MLIVIDASDDPFAERIRAEVSALGLEVVAVEPWRTGEAIESLDAAGRANQAAAAIRMVASRKGVEIWVANQPTGRSLLRQLIVDESAPAPNEGLVALQTAELLRTTPAVDTDPGPGKAARTPARCRRGPAVRSSPLLTKSRRSGAAAAFGAMFSPATGDAQMQVWFTVQRVIAGQLGIALDAACRWVRHRDRPRRVGARVERAGRSRAVHPFRVIGAAGLRDDRRRWRRGACQRRGRRVGPFRRKSDSAVTGAVYARADAGFEATRWLRFGLRAVAGAAPTGVKVRFAGNDAGVWGRPFLAGFVVTDLSW